MPAAFADVTLVIVLAAILGLVARVLRQPTLVAYLVAGILVGAFGLLEFDGSAHVLDLMASFGITLLLFLVGMQMRFDTLKTVGRAALLTGVGQILFTCLIGFGIVKLLGYSTVSALYIAVAITFSSTIIVVKLLSEKRDLQSLYGRIVVGFLLVQDVVAIFMLIFLASYQQNATGLQITPFLLTLAKSAALFGIMLWLSQKVLPWFFEKLARSQELLFVTSIAWAFGISLFVASDIIGLSIEIGGFLAGVALAKSLEQYQIESQIRPLRDFFIVIFFIVLGSTLVISDFSSVLGPAILLSFFVLIGNPLIVLIIMGLLGYRKKTSFYASVTVAQISEFSLIVMSMGLTLGHIGSQEVSLVTLVGIITIVLSTYLILYSKELYPRLEKILGIFEKKNAKEESAMPAIPAGSIVIAGANRLGGHLLRKIQKKKVVIVDLDPVVAKRLEEDGYRVVFGDVTEPDIQEHIRLEDASVIISTIPDLNDTLLLLGILREQDRKKNRPTTIVTAYTNWEAQQLYDAGADYVILPHFVSGQHLATLLKSGRLNTATMQQWRRHDVKILDSLKKQLS
ncbi:MAG: cation:proton antiporter [Candidatus Nomurabacteria bacterium]|nr:MAG: cation:proton antiporter [Candidatus Nomurabacteria bacterium]